MCEVNEVDGTLGSAFVSPSHGTLLVFLMGGEGG